ncbi:hypothetical protein CG740_38005 [Streptomyces sp. CB01201]|uniref:polyprenyl synthetase family protein n=1 Tax=Streptomyces sp. CB01201 TaxID=2020324 RepID=UPI000C27BF59|nr:polyprenyl synthetase family protein [Streptomyces sp. CB01201]PJM97974.1 hypothetical protein CG740_38005 [Streptomyces sp. CB01201]
MHEQAPSGSALAGGPSTPADVLDATAGARGEIPGLLQRAVQELHPGLRRVSAYHFGWADAQGQPITAASPGKLLRARLTLLCAAAAGAPSRMALAGAVAMELVHNYTLLHDDIVDADELRRDRPAAWITFGTPMAIVTGDAIIALALRQLPMAEPGGRQALVVLLDSLAGLGDGESAELALETIASSDVTYDHYAEVAQKTTALLSACAGVGACLGGADQMLTAALQSAAVNVGLAWQAANDVEDIWGDSRVTGKMSCNDLRSGKKTLPVIAALRSGTEAGNRLAMLLDQGERLGEVQVEEAVRLVEAAGGRRYAERLSARYLQTALDTLRGHAMVPAVKEELAQLFNVIVLRSE